MAPAEPHTEVADNALSSTAAVGLDVCPRGSIRLAAVCADELLEEGTLPYDLEEVGRALRRSRRVRCCYEAGRTGFGLHRHLVERGIGCSAVAPGPLPRRPSERIKTDAWHARKLPACSLSGLLEPTHACATGIASRSSACVTGSGCRARPGASADGAGSPSSASLCPRSSRPSTPTCTRSTWWTLGSGGSKRAIAETAAQGPWRELVARLRCLRGIDTLTALAITAEIGNFERSHSGEKFTALVGLDRRRLRARARRLRLGDRAEQPLRAER